MNLEQLREFCLSLPGTTEDVKWEDHLCFSVGGKMYYITSFNHPSSSLKVNDEEFAEVSSRDGIIPAPYLARNKWIQVAGYDVLSRKEWEHYIRQSYELIKSKLPKKIQKELEGSSSAKASEDKSSSAKASGGKSSSAKASGGKPSFVKASGKAAKKKGAGKPTVNKTDRKKAAAKKTAQKTKASKSQSKR